MSMRSVARFNASATLTTSPSASFHWFCSIASAISGPSIPRTGRGAFMPRALAPLTLHTAEARCRLRNAPTELMRNLNYGKGYRYVHEDPAARTEQTHLPEQLGKKKYYRPKKKQ